MQSDHIHFSDACWSNPVGTFLPYLFCTFLGQQAVTACNSQAVVVARHPEMVGRSHLPLPTLTLGCNATATARTTRVTASTMVRRKFEIRANSMEAIEAKEAMEMVLESLISSRRLLLLLVLDLGGGRGTPETTGGGSTTELCRLGCQFNRELLSSSIA